MDVLYDVVERLERLGPLQAHPGEHLACRYQGEEADPAVTGSSATMGTEAHTGGMHRVGGCQSR